MLRVFSILTSWDTRIGTLPVAGELVHTEELNGEDTIDFSSWETPDKGERLLWLDGDIWREHVVVRTEGPMAGVCNMYAESSLCEMLDDFIEDSQLVNRTAVQALTAALAPTRWMIEHCDSLGTAGCLTYHQNAPWALRRVAGVRKGEVTPVIAVSDGRVVYRAVRLESQRGSWRVRTFGDSVLARVTVGTVQPVDYASVSTLVADVAALQDDITGIDGNLTTAASMQVVESTVAEAVGELDELGEVEF